MPMVILKYILDICNITRLQNYVVFIIQALKITVYREPTDLILVSLKVLSFCTALQKGQ